MPRAKLCYDGVGRFYGVRFDCPGCALLRGTDGGKVLPVEWLPSGAEQSKTNAERPRWGFNGDLDRPTFTPSVLTRWSPWEPPVNADNLEAFKAAPWPQRQVEHVCHSFVTDGRIQFLNDCTHALAGQTVDLPEIED